MELKDRNGVLLPGDDGQDKLLQFLYGTAVGRQITKLLVKPGVSRFAGWVLDGKLSKCAIRPFLKKSHIDMGEYEQREFTSFNDFFTRRILPGKRSVDMEITHLTAPCDSRLSVYPIGADSKFRVKNTEYTLAQLLKDETLAKHYEGGTLLLFRLTVDDYHRYNYVDSGEKGENIRIPGVLYTVNPIANDCYPIYKENTREYTLIETERFGRVLQMEVGATMVGRIVNYHGTGTVTRGAEKGRFEFGGSTVIVILEADRAQIDEDLIQNTLHGVETRVKMGEKIGVACLKPE